MPARRLPTSTPTIPASGKEATLPASRREHENARSRAKIINAARRLFLKRGFDDVSMRDIAKAAGFTPGALYVHFPDKVALIFTMMQQDFRTFDDGMREAMNIVDPVVRLREIARGYVRFALAHPHHYKLMFMTEPPDLGQEHNDINCDYADADREGYNMCRLTVADCIRQGRFLPAFRDTETVSQMCWGCVHGVVSLYITHGKMPWARFSDPLRSALLAIDAHLGGLTGAQIGDDAKADAGGTR
jgi:AcrR family transcriptional regulator